jgi:hypothetical protein
LTEGVITKDNTNAVENRIIYCKKPSDYFLLGRGRIHHVPTLCNIQ